MCNRIRNSVAIFGSAGSVLAGALVFATAALAQQPPSVKDAYLGAVQRYMQTGDALTAVATIPGWSQAQFERAVTAVIFASDPTEEAAAAVLQLEIALNVASQSPATASGFLELGERLLLHLDLRSRPAGRLRELGVEISALSEKWYVVAASAFLMVNEVSRAEPWINKGLKTLPGSSELRMLAGIISELRAVELKPTEAARVSLRAPLARQRATLLRMAEASYRRVLADDPSFVPARIRLGRLLLLRADVGSAREELARAQQEAQEPSQRYLAAMFMGALLEQQHDMAAAAAAYEQALMHQPLSQAATVAAGYMALMAGRPDRARALAISLVTARAAVDDWWAYQKGDRNAPAMAWLRDLVRR